MVECQCGARAVYSGPLCADCLRDWLWSEIHGELEGYLSGVKRIAVASSGGKDSTTLLEAAHDWAEEKGVDIFAICVDEGIAGYRDKSLAFLRQFCSQKGIPLHVFSFKEEFGKPLDEFVKKKGELGACAVCGTFRRWILNKRSRDLDADVILLAHNLDDELQTLFMNLFSGNLDQLRRKGEMGGIVEHELFVPRMKPLIRLPEKAFATFSAINYTVPGDECPYLEESSRSKYRQLLNEIAHRDSDSKSRMMNFYLQTLLPRLKESHEPSSGLNKCQKCDEPTSREICRACELKSL